MKPELPLKLAPFKSAKSWIGPEVPQNILMNKPMNPWKLPGYKAGQNIACKIVAQEPGGYRVHIPKDNLPGFLPTEQPLKIGEEILAQFVCVHNNRILLSARFSANSPQDWREKTQTIRWEEKLEDKPPLAEQNESAADEAFLVWAHATPRKIRLRRAVDLLMPPQDGSTPNKFKIKDYDLEWLITDLEGGMRTGCVKASSEERLSRSAMLLYRGRVVGCIYGCKSMNEPHPTEQSLAFMLNDLNSPETELSVYDLPEDITLSMSALFMGYPVQRSEAAESRKYFDYLANWFSDKKQTACMAVTLPSVPAMCLVFFHGGKHIGNFYIENQGFTTGLQYVHDLLAKYGDAQIEASILPQELTSQAVRYGFNLSMAQKGITVQS